MKSVNVKFELVNGGTPLKQAHYGDAGLDAYSNVNAVVKAGERLVVPLGIKVELPHGYVLQVCPRSGLAAKKGITVLNSPGIVDSGYRGEIQAIVMNHGDEDFIVKRHNTRICQFIIQESPNVIVDYGKIDPNTSRGEGMLGSSGGMGNKDKFINTLAGFKSVF